MNYSDVRMCADGLIEGHHYQQGLGNSEDFVLCQVAVLILVVKREEPFNGGHQVAEHYGVQTIDKILGK